MKNFVFTKMQVLACTASMVFLSVLLNVGCTKDDPFDGLSIEQKLRSHPWRLTKAEIRFEGKWEDFDHFGACEFDDTYTFLNSDSLMVNHGLQLCDVFEPNTEIGGWELLADESGFSTSNWVFLQCACEYRFEKLKNGEMVLTTEFFVDQPERYTFLK